ncbi:MAG: transglutaminase-like domain-containing protein [Verrucomicrobiota bacterium]
MQVGCRAGLLPAYEEIAREVIAGCLSDSEKAVALLKRGASRVKHPDGPPCGEWVEGDRNLDDEALLASGCGWCNEQARVFIRLCQVCGIPARMILLFYSDEKSGHSIAEFYADGRWCMADATWFCVFPDESGRLLSASECHDGGPGQRMCGIAYASRWKELLELTEEEVNFKTPEKTAEWRKAIAGETPESLAAKHYYFAVINYPLPR